MNSNNLAKVLSFALVIVLVVGVFDAVIGSDWDLLAVMALALGLYLWMVARAQLGRPTVRLRRDLLAWLRERSEVTGETIPALADRAVAHYRDRYGTFDARRRP